MWRIPAAAAVACVMLTGCGAGAPERPATTTKPEPSTSPAAVRTACVPDEGRVTASTVEQGLQDAYVGTSLERGYLVPLDGIPGYRFIYAAAIPSPDGGAEAVGAWAMGGPTDGPIIALNGPAMLATDWGAAAEPGSPADDQRKAFRDLLATVLAVECVRDA